LAAIPAMCTAAVLCGCASLDDVTAWIGGAGPRVPAALGCRRDAAGVLTPPHPETVPRVFTDPGAQGLADHAGAFLGHPGLPLDGPGWLPGTAVDGKAVRGAVGADGMIPYPLAAATHTDSAVTAERLIGPKTNEVPELAPLPRELNHHVPLSGHVITADAGHTVRARFLREEPGAHFVMTVKTNTPTLFAALDALDWTAVPIGHQVTETGHGRSERRTIQVIDAPDHIASLFPHVSQVFLVERPNRVISPVVRRFSVGVVLVAGSRCRLST